MQRWGFIYTLGADATTRRVDVIGSPTCELIAVGVASPADGADAATWLVDQGAELVEMCGAFGPADQASVAAALSRSAAEHPVPHGAVTYPCDQAAGSTASSADPPLQAPTGPRPVPGRGRAPVQGGRGRWTRARHHGRCEPWG